MIQSKLLKYSYHTPNLFFISTKTPSTSSQFQEDPIAENFASATVIFADIAGNFAISLKF